MAWSKCWKCSVETKSREQTPYLHCREGKFNFCQECFDQFLETAEPWIQRARMDKGNKIKRALHALSRMHDKLCSSSSSSKNRYSLWDCNECSPTADMINNLRNENEADK